MLVKIDSCWTDAAGNVLYHGKAAAVATSRISTKAVPLQFNGLCCDEYTLSLIRILWWSSSTESHEALNSQVPTGYLTHEVSGLGRSDGALEYNF